MTRAPESPSAERENSLLYRFGWSLGRTARLLTRGSRLLLEGVGLASPEADMDSDARSVVESHAVEAAVQKADEPDMADAFEEAVQEADEPDIAGAAEAAVQEAEPDMADAFEEAVQGADEPDVAAAVEAAVQGADEPDVAAAVEAAVQEAGAAREADGLSRGKGS